MNRIPKERDRLLRRAARFGGLAGTVGAIACLTAPGAIPGDELPTVALLSLALVASVLALTNTGALYWTLPAVGLGLAIIVVTGLSSPALSDATSTAIVLQASIGIASVVLVLLTSRRGRILAGGYALATLVVVSLVATRGDHTVAIIALSVAGWGANAVLAVWIDQGSRRAMSRIDEIGRAHRAERFASELEAQQRQDARLLHDTVLATLSLLAHSGVGVSPESLRHQASDDARLLRQLRLGGTAGTRNTDGLFTPEPEMDSVLGQTLESVKQRFGRMGLAVRWHGSGQVLLPRETLDAFLGALGECLENVRRHAGVSEADVTITDDDIMVRAMVTDAGVGFNIDDVDGARLGYAESVVGRLRSVNGRARLFSSPGAGTTVVLEVPKS